MSSPAQLELFEARVTTPTPNIAVVGKRQYIVGWRCPHLPFAHGHVTEAQCHICGLQEAGWRWRSLRRATKEDREFHHLVAGRWHMVDAMRYMQLMPPEEILEPPPQEAPASSGTKNTRQSGVPDAGVPEDTRDP